MTNPLKVASIFNNYFVNVGPNLAKKIKHSYSQIFNTLPNPTNTMYLNPTDENEILKIIKSLNLKKTLGPNSIPTHILKDNAHILSSPLSLLVNQFPL